MKKTSILLLLTMSLFLTACGSTSSDEKTSVTILQPSAETLNPYQIFVEEMLANRTTAYRLFEQVKDHDPFKAKDLDDMHRMTLRYLKTKEISDDYVSRYQYLVEEDDPQYSERERMKLIMISLSAMLIRYDDYLLAYKKFDDETRLRQFLNDADSAYDIPANTLQDIANKYNSTFERDDIKDMIDFYQDNISKYKDDQDAFLNYLRRLIEESRSYQRGFDYRTEYTNAKLENIYGISFDRGDDTFDLFLNEISKDFGNTAGLVATRKGKLYDDADVAANIRSTIQPGDILLEKTPFRLTDQLIPGHWGHAAVYIGTEDELEALGVWKALESAPGFSSERIDAIRQQISDGKVVDEALRDGVQLNTIEHFLNIDDLAIMHDTVESNETKKERIILTLRQLGKEYDFKFDIETSDKIVCSELIYATYFLDWETESIAGINTISPDNVAVKSVEDESRFIIPLLYHDGVEVTTERKAYMQGLLNGSIE
jgi:uncharacterized protein YycO